MACNKRPWACVRIAFSENPDDTAHVTLCCAPENRAAARAQLKHLILTLAQDVLNDELPIPPLVS